VFGYHPAVGLSKGVLADEVVELGPPLEVVDLVIVVEIDGVGVELFEDLGQVGLEAV